MPGPAPASDQKEVRPTASGTGLVLVWPARNGTASDTAAAGSDGAGSVTGPVPWLLNTRRLPGFRLFGSSACPGFLPIIGLSFAWISGPMRKKACSVSGPVRSGHARPRRFSASDQKEVRPTASGTGLVLGEHVCLYTCTYIYIYMYVCINI